MFDLATSTIWIAFGSLFTGIGGVWFSLISKEKTPRQHKMAVWLVIIGTLSTAFGGVLSQSEQSNFQHGLEAKNEEIIRLNQQTIETITGGNSYCYLRLANATREAALLTLVHVGSAPLYDISIRIGDFQIADRYLNEPPTLENLAKSQTVFNVGNLGRQYRMLLGRLPLGGTQRDFNIFIAARNGSVRQLGLNIEKVSYGANCPRILP